MSNDTTRSSAEGGTGASPKVAAAFAACTIFMWAEGIIRIWFSKGGDAVLRLWPQRAGDIAGNPVLDCMCGNILCGRFDPSLSFFTPHGSFWSNHTTKLLASTSAADRQARTRNRCNSEGYESVALLPIRIHDETLGLFQFNSAQPGRFNLERIQLLEQLVDYVDIAMAKLQADASLSDSETSLRQAQRVAHVGSWKWHIPTNRVEWSDEMYHIFGLTKSGFTGSLNDVIAQAIHPDDRAKVVASNAAVIHDKKPAPVEYRVIWPDQTVRVVWAEAGNLVLDPAGNSLLLTGIAQDITDQRRSEENLARHQAQVAHLARVNTMGQLAAGLAHELNQPLMAIRNYTHYSLSLVETGRKQNLTLPEALLLIDQQADRAGKIIQRLRTFVRNEEPQRTLLNLNDLVSECVDLMGTPLRHSQIKAETHLAPNLPAVLADRVQIEQVLVNLVQNAIDAMEQTPPEERRILLTTSVAVGQNVRILVHDQGCGVPPEDMDLIFQEFHSTKAEGLGFGLAISKSIIESHGGRLTAQRNSDRGMTFEIMLPRETTGA